MPATRPRASFEPIPPDFDLKALVESTHNFSYVDRISVDMIGQQGLPAFEKLVLLHVIIGGKPLVIDGFEHILEPWTFAAGWLDANCGDKQENARVLNTKQNMALTMGHYLKNLGMLTNQFFGKPGAYRDPKRQRVYLKDIDCPPVWQDKLREQIPSVLFYLNESTGDVGGPGATIEHNVPGKRWGKGIARAGDLMSSLPPDMRAENLMCYIGHEGTYTPAHREMCASLGQNIMVEASKEVNEDGKPEKPGSSIWFMTESKDRHLVSEYWLSVLGHDIEVESHFAQVVAWKKAPFNVYVVEQRPGDFILIPPLAPHQVWNRGTRTMKVAWNRTTVETLEMALNEALPRSRIVCRDEQYKNKAIVYYTLQKYSSLLTLAQSQASRLPSQEAAHQLLTSPKIKQLAKDFKRLFSLYRQILLSETFGTDEPAPKGIEYLPFDGNVTCAYCRGNIFNRFLTCPWCKDVLGHHAGDGEGDPYDICMDCYAMGRSCACISNLKWTEQFRWKELTAKYDTWRELLITLDGGQVTHKTPLPIIEERKRLGKRTLAEVCRDQLKRRPWKDIRKPANEPKSDEDEEEEIIVDDHGIVKKVQKKKSKTWLKNHANCHVCCKQHPIWKMAQCTTCERYWCYGTLFRGWDKMPIEIMEDKDWVCPHCLKICFAGACKREGKMTPYEPKGTLLGHDTRKVADIRSVEALVDFSVSNLNWLKEDDPANRAESKRLQRAGVEAQKAKEMDPSLDDEDADGIDESRIDMEDVEADPAIDPALGGGRYDDESLAWRLQQANAAHAAGGASQAAIDSTPDGFVAVNQAGYIPPPANMYPQPDEAGASYTYPGAGRAASDEPYRDGSEELVGGLRPFKRRHREEDDDDEDINMTKHPKMKKPRLTANGFRSVDLADPLEPTDSQAKTEAQRQYEKKKQIKAIEKAKSEGRFIMRQARLKGKKRIVKLHVSRERLTQFIAQMAAKAALSAGDEADAGHEADEDVQNETTEADDGEMVLKSDIQPKIVKNPRAVYQQRQEEGRIIVGGSKKALVPIEKDENYREYRPKQGLPNGKKAKAKAHSRAAPVEYEEVDIGSDVEEEGDDDDGNSMFVSNGSGSAAKRREKDRRSLPGYLARRDDHGNPDGPLEEESQEQAPARKAARQRQSLGASQARRMADGTFATPKRQPKPSTGRPVGRPPKKATANGGAAARDPTTGGKRPSMRPSFSTPTAPVDVDDDDDELDEETRDALDAAANGDWMDVDETMDDSHAAPAPDGAAPAPNGASVREAGMSTAEQNRLAKLEALEMVDGMGAGTGAGGGGRKLVRMADVLDDEEDEDDDDGVDEVPARGGVRV